MLRAGQLLDAARRHDARSRNDTLALYGPVARLLNAAKVIGPEVDVPELRDIQRETVDVVAHRPDAVGHKLGELAASDVGHGLYLNAMFRGGAQIPRRARHRRPSAATSCASPARAGASTTLEADHRPRRPPEHQHRPRDARAGRSRWARPSAPITIPIGALKLAIGSAVGLLLVGIVLSILRTR